MLFHHNFVFDFTPKNTVDKLSQTLVQLGFKRKKSIQLKRVSFLFEEECSFILFAKIQPVEIRTCTPHSLSLDLLPNFDLIGYGQSKNASLHEMAQKNRLASHLTFINEFLMP